MFSIIPGSVKHFLLFLLGILIVFLTVVFLQNKTTLIIGMKAPKQLELQARIYYTEEGQPFSEKKSSNPFKIEGEKYYFFLPDSSAIEYIRLDPSLSPVDDISIKNMTVVQLQWFKKTIYTLSLNNIKPLQQINNFQIDRNKVKFSSAGNDPQLLVRFRLQVDSISTMPHINLLLGILLVFIIGFYLYGVAKTQKINEFLTAKLILYSLFFALALFKVDYYKDHIRFAYPPDEIAHLSYIDYVHEHNELVPKFENMHMMNNHSAGNYLSHPPLYYKILDLAYDDTISLIQNVDNFRTVSMILFLLSFVILLYFGFSANISILAHFVYLSVISSIPMYAYLGGSISNDNLAILGAAIFIIGLKRLIENNYGNISFVIIGLGILLSYFSKLTAAVLIFFALLYFLVYAVKSRQIFNTSRYQIVILLILLLPIAYYQIYILSSYHALIPTFNVTNPEQYLKSGFFVEEKYRHYLTHIEWLERMKNYIVGGWFGIHSHHSFTKDSVFEYIGLLILHIFALAALFMKCRDDKKSYCLVGKIVLLSLLSVLVVQYFQSYHIHLHTGYLGGIQPRYLLPFMFGFAILASLFVEKFKQYFWWNIFIVLICVQAIYSDFFYFLNNYS